MKAIPVCKTCRYRYKNRCKKIQYSDGQDYVICSINPVSKDIAKPLSFEETGGIQMIIKKEIGEALDLCMELLEKATPKKPILEAMRGFSDEIASHLVCPVCKMPIVNVWSRKEYRPRYCHVCGQRLDWSDTGVD